MRGSRMTVQLASMGDAVMERPRRRDLARFHVRPRVRPVLGESPPDARRVGAVQQGGEAQHVALVPVCFSGILEGH